MYPDNVNATSDTKSTQTILEFARTMKTLPDFLAFMVKLGLVPLADITAADLGLANYTGNFQQLFKQLLENDSSFSTEEKEVLQNFQGILTNPNPRTTVRQDKMGPEITRLKTIISVLENMVDSLIREIYQAADGQSSDIAADLSSLAEKFYNRVDREIHRAGIVGYELAGNN